MLNPAEFISFAKKIGPYVPRPELESAFVSLKNTIVQDPRPLIKEIPAECTLPRLCLLARYGGKPECFEAIIETLMNASPVHLNVAMDLLCELLDDFTLMICKTAQPAKVRRHAAVILEIVLKKLEESGFDKECLTPVHTDLLCLYLTLAERGRAVPLIRQRFTTAHSPAKFSASALLFFYYSGIAFTWNNDYEAAEKCFELVCFSPPLEIPSWIVLCSFRKLLLTSLIVRGCVLPYVVRRMRSFLETRGGGEETHLGTYEALVDEYQEMRVLNYSKRIELECMVLRADGNLGLAKVAQARMLHHLVLKARTLYSACTLEQILQCGGLGGNKAHEGDLREAIDELHASGAGVSFTNPERTMISFEDDSSCPEFSTADSVSRFEQRVRKVLDSSSKLEIKRQANEAAAAFRSEHLSAIRDALYGSGGSGVSYGNLDDDDDDDMMGKDVKDNGVGVNEDEDDDDDENEDIFS